MLRNLPQTNKDVIIPFHEEIDSERLSDLLEFTQQVSQGQDRGFRMPSISAEGAESQPSQVCWVGGMANMRV